jgi:hypothetical protein
MAATIKPAPADEELKLETEMAETTGATSPVSWWLIGLVALLALAVVLFALQCLGGNTGTDVIPGTPIAASQSAG